MCRVQHQIRLIMSSFLASYRINAKLLWLPVAYNLHCFCKCYSRSVLFLYFLLSHMRQRSLRRDFLLFNNEGFSRGSFSPLLCSFRDASFHLELNAASRLSQLKAIVFLALCRHRIPSTSAVHMWFFFHSHFNKAGHSSPGCHSHLNKFEGSQKRKSRQIKERHAAENDRYMCTFTAYRNEYSLDGIYTLQLL